MTLNFFTVNIGPKNDPAKMTIRNPPIRLNINKLENVAETWRRRYPSADFRVVETRSQGTPQGSVMSVELWIRYQTENRNLRRNEEKREFDFEAEPNSKKRKIDE